jgi:hypothetical protein
MNTTVFGSTCFGVFALAGLFVACGSSDDSTLGGTGGASSGGSKASGGSAGADGSASGGSSAGGSAGAPSCTGTHPLLDGGTRFCAVGECRCEATDMCFPRASAASCCEGPFTCFQSDGPLECTRQHPAVDGSVRFCETGRCYCAPADTCFPAAIAAVCCPTEPQCL